MINPQNIRLLTRSLFFLAYLLAPVFDIFRFDLPSKQFIVLRQHWDIGIDAFLLEQITIGEMLWNFVSMVFIPIASFIGITGFVSWRWGLLYCGWLCPHESVVEIINRLMRQASGRMTLWERKTPPEYQQDGVIINPNRQWWLVTAVVIVLIALVWAISLLAYILPPSDVYQNLITASFTRPQLLFLGIASGLFIVEFTFARHLFCRFGCSLGLFQSLMWMLNKKAMVVGFDRTRVKECVSCDKSCEISCPIRLKPRSIKRKMYSCSQCTRCIDACANVQNGKDGGEPLLQMLNNDCALDVSARDFGKKGEVPNDCYRS